MVEKVDEGDILEGPFWREPVRVITTESVGGGEKIYAVGTDSQENFTQILSSDQVESKIEVTKREEGPDFDGSPKEFKEGVEAARIDLASQYDSHHALSSSQVDPVPHQLEAVYKYMLPENFTDNRIKFFLADDAGAGKTIMTGLLLKELKQRGILENCLILAPAKLQRQWQKELLRLFDEEFRIIDRSEMNRLASDPWSENKFCITSMAFSIQDDVKESLKDMQWDMVVVDEAHHLSAYRYGADEEEDKTERYKVGEILRENSIHRLLLSATPHKGRRDHFQLLLRLLDNDLFAEEELPREIIRSDDPGTVFLRRMKEDMVDLHGNALFNDRSVHTVSYEIHGEELEFYEKVTRYVEDQFQSAWKKENRHVQFALIVLQRRVASSIRAARESLQRRREGLQELLEDVDKLREAEQARAPDPEELEEMAERQRWEIEEDALRRLTMSGNREQLKNEIDTLRDLVSLAQDLEAKGAERKLEELRELLKGQQEDTPFGRDEKMVIFTEAKDTLDLLTENLEAWGYEYVTIHGGMEMGQAKDPNEGTRLWAEEQFNDSEGPQILVATDAAGEGINLHKECRLMVNYDIPWNPTRLEQRMGRIHRYGQEDPVHIYNLVASNTREGYVLEKLSMKLEKMKEDIGSDRVFDIISELSQEVSLDNLIRDVVSGSADTKDADMRLDSLDEKGEEAVERATSRGLATRHIDLAQVQEWLRKDKERRLTPEYIEKFFVNAFKLLEGNIEKRQDGFWRIEWVPAHIRRAADETQYGSPDQKYTKFTFYKDESDEYSDVEFVSPGHPLFEAVKTKAKTEFAPALNKGGAYIDPDTSDSYMLWFVRQELQDGNRETVGKRIFCIKETPNGDFKQINEAVLHDIKPVHNEISHQKIVEAAENHSGQEEALDWFYDNAVTSYQEEVEEEKKEVIETIRPSMKKALNSAIVQLNEEIRDLEEEAEAEQKHRDMERAIDNKKRKRDNLIERRDEQLERLDQAEHIFPTEPRVIGSAVVLSPSDHEESSEEGGMSRDDEVEEIGMQISMEYEQDHGREPEDVAEENLGFDVRSVGEEDDGSQEWRYIEVKGRAGEGKVALTENEWTMARRLGEEFYLYIVTNTKTDDPDLHVIQDPASRLEPDEHTVVRYFVDQNDWRSEITEEEQ
jgi:SNF2 family DNA or RNA helicase